MTTEWLKNEKITLRAPEPEDLDLLYEMENDTTLWNIGNNIQPFSHYTLRNYLTQAKQDIYADKQIRFIIELKNNELAGIIDLIDFDPYNKRAEVCIGLLKKHRGKGIGYSALSVISKYAFKLLQINQLYAYITEDNHHSRNLFAKAGYKENAILKEWKLQENRYSDVIIVQLFNTPNAV